jgi:hypothetical protein
MLMSAFKQVAKRVSALVLTAAVMVVGCSVPRAAAQPAGFPDLNTFAPVSADGFLTKKSKGSSDLSTVDFSTPYNIGCGFSASQDPSTTPSQYINCDGDLPGMDNVPIIPLSGTTHAPGDCIVGIARPAGMDGPAYGLSRTYDGGCNGRPAKSSLGGKLLSAGQKISYQNVTCAVGPNKLVACLDTTSGEHGFVLQPSGSFAF